MLLYCGFRFVGLLAITSGVTCFAQVQTKNKILDKLENVHIIENSFQVLNSFNVLDCMSECLKIPNCVSAQFGFNRCELFDITQAHFGVFEHSSSCVYMYTTPLFNCSHVFGASCYWVNSNSVTWPAANESCAIQGAHLADVHSAAEHDFIVSILDSPAWLGASDLAVEGEWRWVANNDLMTYDDKLSADGGDSLSGGEADCLVKGSDDHWHDINCELRFMPFLCEYP